LTGSKTVRKDKDDRRCNYKVVGTLQGRAEPAQKSRAMKAYTYTHFRSERQRLSEGNSTRRVKQGGTSERGSVGPKGVSEIKNGGKFVAQTRNCRQKPERNKPGLRPVLKKFGAYLKAKKKKDWAKN